MSQTTPSTPDATEHPAPIPGPAIRSSAGWPALMITLAAAAGLALDFGWLSMDRSAGYQDDVYLWLDASRHSLDNPIVLNNLGLALASAGRPTEAARAYERALELRPEFPHVLNNLGLLLLGTDQQRALELLEQAVRLDPRYADGFNNLGHALLAMNRAADAVAALERAVQLRPQHADARSNLGSALVRAGRPQEAIEQFELVLAAKPDDLDARNGLAAALLSTHRAADAIEHLQKAIAVKPDSAEVWANLAIAQAQTQQSAAAVETAEKALQLARDQNQTALAQQIEAWLAAYRAGQVDSSSEPAANPPGPALPPAP